MSLAGPAKISSIDGFEAVVDIGGVGRAVGLFLTPEAWVGDYVYVHTGHPIRVVDEAEALESLKILGELAEVYPVDDLFLSTGDSPPAVGSSRST